MTKNPTIIISVLDMFTSFHFFLISNYWLRKCLVRKKKISSPYPALAPPTTNGSPAPRPRRVRRRCVGLPWGETNSSNLKIHMFGRWSFPLGMAQPARCELSVSEALKGKSSSNTERTVRFWEDRNHDNIPRNSLELWRSDRIHS